MARGKIVVAVGMGIGVSRVSMVGISVGIGSISVVSISSGSSFGISGPLAPVVGNGVAVGTVGISVGIGSVRVVGISLSSGSRSDVTAEDGASA